MPSKRCPPSYIDPTTTNNDYLLRLNPKPYQLHIALPGIEQADLTGKRLAELAASYGDSGRGFAFTSLTHSTMSRAHETASHVHRHVLPGDKMTEDSMLVEGAPIPPEPPLGSWRPEKSVKSLAIVFWRPTTPTPFLHRAI